jgi:hypothetical protein
VAVSFEIDGVVYYDKSVSLRNPPLLCFGVPYLEKGAELCLRLYNITWQNGSYSGCLDLAATLFDIKVAQVKIGCFHFGNHSVSINNRKNFCTEFYLSNKTTQVNSQRANQTWTMLYAKSFFLRLLCLV